MRQDYLSTSYLDQKYLPSDIAWVQYHFLSWIYVDVS